MEAGLSADAPIVARHGAAATSQRLATQVAVDLLRAGGSAVDAALGANAMLSLIEPHMCGPGGDLFALVWEPGERRLHGLNASGRAARRLEPCRAARATGRRHHHPDPRRPFHDRARRGARLAGAA
ncbi:MAG: gamma-glutamyltransferase [Proteobacteria bacterium]|nr:gamma-glutamyltransferase [Pseudomonadota bacterium]